MTPDLQEPSEKPKPIRDPAYAAQREELTALLKKCAARYLPLLAYEKPVLSPEDVTTAIQKIKHGHAFSRREKAGLIEAGFDLHLLYPDL